MSKKIKGMDLNSKIMQCQTFKIFLRNADEFEMGYMLGTLNEMLYQNGFDFNNKDLYDEEVELQYCILKKRLLRSERISKLA